MSVTPRAGRFAQLDEEASRAGRSARPRPAASARSAEPLGAIVFCDADLMFEAIEETDWAAIPGFAMFYDPSAIAPALRDLARADSATRAAVAAGPLSSAILHDHSGGVHPACVTATPILLDIAERAHPAVWPVVLGLLSDAMCFEPYPGFTTVRTDEGMDIPLCCAIAGHLRARRLVIAAAGRQGREILVEADAHWQFNVTETAADADATTTLALGILHGALERPPRTCECYRPGQGVLGLATIVEVAAPASDASGEACLLLHGVSPETLPPGCVLRPPCGDRDN